MQPVNTTSSKPKLPATGNRKNRWWVWAAFLLWTLGVTVAFDRYAYEINEFNTTTRVWLRTGQVSGRVFNSDGIPVSYSSASGRQFVSPFYVVHYGLIYSEAARSPEFTGDHWRPDPSLEYWNIPPPDVRSEWFENTAKWVVDNIDYVQGHAHLIYSFDWPYRGYPGGRLTAPWWSGLTDGYAIILLLRAYDVYGDRGYLSAAEALYRSVLTRVEEGGSLIELEGLPWIEEYVDPRAAPEQMSYVLNGMIYATYGVEAFEKFAADADSASHPALYNAIAATISQFDMGYWSRYDLIGTTANIKYHRIHVALLDDLIARRGLVSLQPYAEAWRTGAEHPLGFWVVFGLNTFAKFHFLLVLLSTVALFPLGVVLFSTIRRRSSRRAVRKAHAS